MAELNALSETDASNTSISAANVAEGCAPSSINDAIRNLAGMAKRALDRDHAGSWCTVGGTANAITLAYTAGPSSYVQGEKFAFKATAANTGAATANISGLGAKNIYVIANGTPTALNGNEIANGGLHEIEYDGTQFQLLNPAPDEGSFSPTWVGTGVAGTFTYTKQVGRYIRLGNLVTFWGRLTISAIAVTPTGTLTLAGLPFTASNVADLDPPLTIGVAGGFTFPAGFTQLMGTISPATAMIQMNEFGSGQISTAFNPANLGAAADILFSGSYRIN